MLSIILLFIKTNYKKILGVGLSLFLLFGIVKIVDLLKQKYLDKYKTAYNALVVEQHKKEQEIAELSKKLADALLDVEKNRKSSQASSRITDRLVPVPTIDPNTLKSLEECKKVVVDLQAEYNKREELYKTTIADLKLTNESLEIALKISLTKISAQEGLINNLSEQKTNLATQVNLLEKQVKKETFRKKMWRGLSALLAVLLAVLA